MNVSYRKKEKTLLVCIFRQNNDTYIIRYVRASFSHIYIYEVSNDHQSCIYFIKNTVETEILWNIMKYYYNFKYLFSLVSHNP